MHTLKMKITLTTGNEMVEKGMIIINSTKTFNMDKNYPKICVTQRKYMIYQWQAYSVYTQNTRQLGISNHSVKVYKGVVADANGQQHIHSQL